MKASLTLVLVAAARFSARATGAEIEFAPRGLEEAHEQDDAAADGYEALDFELDGMESSLSLSMSLPLSVEAVYAKSAKSKSAKKGTKCSKEGTSAVCCSSFHGNATECESAQGCKVCEPMNGMYVFCIPEDEVCCETLSEDSGFDSSDGFNYTTCPEEDGTNHEAPIFPDAYNPTDHAGVDPDKGCFYCVGVCMTGVCCEPQDNQVDCDSLDKCFWDENCQGGKCLAHGMECPSVNCAELTDSYLCTAADCCAWIGVNGTCVEDYTSCS